MNEPTSMAETSFQHRLKPNTHIEEPANDQKPQRSQVGLNYRIAPMRQCPVLQFMLVLSNGNAKEIKYSNITDRDFIRQSDKYQANAIVMVVRDSMRVSVSGFCLERLNDDLLMQRVIDLGAVTMLEAEAAIKDKHEQPIITNVKYEHGRWDVENGIWLPGNGQWSDEQQQWITGQSLNVRNGV